MNYTEINSPAQKRIALVAHDNRKAMLIHWCIQYHSVLSAHKLYATGTSGARLEQETGLQVESLLSGPLGGDQQIGSKICEGAVDLLIFFWDPFEPLPHDPDIKALLRIAAVWNIPVACTQSSADFLITSALMGQAYPRLIPDYQGYLAKRIESHTDTV